MRWGFPISLLLHALILGWGLIAMKSTRDFKMPEVQSIALDIISSDELAQMRKGDEKSKDKEAQAAKDAQGKAEKEPPKPKTAAATPPPPAAAEPPPPPEPPKPPEPEVKPEDVLKEMAKTAPKPPPPDVKPTEPTKQEPPKPEADDALAAMKDNQPKPPPLPPAKPPEPPKAAEKPPEKVAEKKPAPPKPPPPKPKAPQKVAEARPVPTPAPPQNRPSSFEEQMRKAGLKPDDATPDPLLNKDPRRQDAAKTSASADAGAKAKTAAGTRDGQGTKISQNEISVLAGQLSRMIKGCYRAQAGNAVALEDLVVKLRFDLGPDGMLRGEPTVLEAARFSLGTQWAVNALKGCQPYRLDPEKYQAWKEWDFIFQP